VNWVLATSLWPRNNIPPYLLPDICKALDNYVPMNLLEERVGRVSYRIPFPSGENLANDDLKAVQKLIKEFSQALEALSDTLLNDVIRECVRLERWLEQRCEKNIEGCSEGDARFAANPNSEIDECEMTTNPSSGSSVFIPT